MQESEVLQSLSVLLYLVFYWKRMLELSHWAVPEQNGKEILTKSDEDVHK